LISEDSAIPVVAQAERTTPVGRQSTIKLLWKHAPSLFIGAVMVAVIALGAVFASVLSPADPIKMDLNIVLQAPSSIHPLGTDDLGRDVLSRTLHGARISLLVGVFVVMFSLIFGTMLGLISGFLGGAADNAIMRVIDAILAIPGVLLAVAISAALGPQLQNVVIAIVITFLPPFARLVRAQVLSAREEDYALAARAIGARGTRIMVRHILPNIMTPVIVLASLRVATAILAEAGLSFLGLGAQPPTPTWGSMVNTGQRYLENAPWIALGPGMAIFLCILGFCILGEGIRDISDPRTRGRTGLGR
jgi:peptide/nickel transport system permease protein